MKLEGTFTDRMKTDGWMLLHQEWPPKEEGSGVNGISNTREPERKKSVRYFVSKNAQARGLL